MKSCLYEGTVRHRRFLPRPHDFEYKVAMPFLRLDEIPALLADRRLWSDRGRALGEYRRSDFLGDPQKPLDSEVRRRIREETGEVHRGPVYLLANLRYFGFAMNPIACYYCYDEAGSHLQYLVAEVNNTPWDERHSYVLNAEAAGRFTRQTFDKAFHVSPFNPMDMQYQWRSNSPGEKLLVHLENHREEEKVFDATLSLEARELTGAALDRLLLGYPLLTVRIAAAIYWQALKLFFKGIPVYPHPASSANQTMTYSNDSMADSRSKQ